MTDLTALSDFPSSELRAEFSRMFGTPSPIPASPSRHPQPIPTPGRLGVGDSHLELCDE
jgi:hypothetical protein